MEFLIGALLTRTTNSNQLSGDSAGEVSPASARKIHCYSRLSVSSRHFSSAFFCRHIFATCGLAVILLAIPSPIQAQPVLTHKQVLTASVNEELKLSAIVKNIGADVSVLVYYRITGTPIFQWQEMSKNGDNYNIRLPRTVLTTAGLDYYISARNSRGQTSSLPSDAPTSYYQVLVQEDNIAPYLLTRNPAEGDTTTNSTPVIAASFYEDNAIDAEKVLVYLDSVNVTAHARIVASKVSYTPRIPLAPGMHTVKIILPDKANNLSAASEWSFVVAPAPKKEIPYTISGQVNASDQYTRARTITGNNHTYASDVSLHASGNMLGYTMNIETGGSFAPGPGGSKAAGKFDHVEMYLNEIPFGILYGDYSQSTKDFGMNYTDLKGVRASYHTQAWQHTSFWGTTTNSNGIGQEFYGYDVKSQISPATSFEAYALHGNDDTSQNSGRNNGYAPIRGDVVGISGAFNGRSALSGSLDYAHSVSAHEHAGERNGNALALETSLRLSPASIATGASYVEKSYHSPGNPYLFSDALTCHSSVSASPLPMLSANASYQFGRTGMHPDSVTQSIDVNSSNMQLTLTPAHSLSVTTTLDYAHKQGSGGTAAPLDNNTVTYSASVTASSGPLNSTASYSFSDENDRGAQTQTLSSHNTSLQCSFAPKGFMSANGGVSYSYSASGGSGPVTKYVTTNLSTTLRLDKTGSNSISVVGSYTSNETSDSQTRSDGLALQCSFLTSLGWEGTHAPRIQMTASRTTGRDLVRHTTTSNQVELSLSLGWTF